MRIGIDARSLEGQRTGVGRYLANILREWEVQKDIVADSEVLLYCKNEEPTGVPAFCRTVLLPTKSNALFKHIALPRAARKDKMDILFCPDYVTPFIYGGKTAVTLHDIIYEARPREFSWPSWADRVLLKYASKRASRTSSVIFAPSVFTQKEVVKHYGVPQEKVVVTPLAADPQFVRMPNNENARRVRARYGLTGPFVFFVGSLFNRRVLPEKIRAFEQFATEHPDFQFCIVGQNHTKPFQDIEAIAKECNENLGRQAVVLRKGIADDGDLATLYNEAFCTLWVSSYEGFGLPLIESMACGTPVITSRDASLPEVGGDAVLYTASRTSEDIYRALKRLADNKNEYTMLVEKGLERASRFSWAQTARLTYDHLINA